MQQVEKNPHIGGKQDGSKLGISKEREEFKIWEEGTPRVVISKGIKKEGCEFGRNSEGTWKEGIEKN